MAYHDTAGHDFGVETHILQAPCIGTQHEHDTGAPPDSLSGGVVYVEPDYGPLVISIAQNTDSRRFEFWIDYEGVPVHLPLDRRWFDFNLKYLTEGGGSPQNITHLVEHP